MTTDIQSDIFYNRIVSSESFKSGAQRLESGVILLPTSSSLNRTSFDNFFIESHLLEIAYISGVYCNWRGQALEIKGDRVITGVGFPTQRGCQILDRVNVYELGRSLQVFVIDKPLVGDYITDPADSKRASMHGGGGPSEWLAAAPIVETDFYDKLQKFRNTFLLVDGFENAAALRISEISSSATDALLNFSQQLLSKKKLIQDDVERAAYATLHVWLYPHLLDVCLIKDNILKNKITQLPNDEMLLILLQAPSDVIANHKKVSAMCTRLEITHIDTIVSPHQKLSAFSRLFESTNQALSSVIKKNDITGEHIIAIFAVIIKNSNMHSFHAHVMHVEMLLSTHPNSLALGQGAYALSTFQSALEVLIQLKGRGPSSARSSLKIPESRSSESEQYNEAVDNTAKANRPVLAVSTK